MGQDASQSTANNEQRAARRERIDDFFKVYDASNGVLMGDLGDLSEQGMRVECDAELEPGSRFAVEIEWKNSSGDVSRFSMSAECRWCRPAAETDRFDAGFQFFDVSVLQSMSLKMMITNFVSNRPAANA